MEKKSINLPSITLKFKVIFGRFMDVLNVEVLDLPMKGRIDATCR